MKETTLHIDLVERMKEIEKENRFFRALEDIGFKVKRGAFFIKDKALHIITHYSLPLNCSFQCDLKEMMITYLSVEPWSWIEAKEKGKPIMTCENFIKWQIQRVRDLTKEILTKLDNRTL